MIIRPNSGFIIPARRFIDVGMPKGRALAKGRYMLVKRDAFGVEIERTPWFDNIILDAGLNRWGTGAIILGAAIGTGTSTPDAAQTALDTQTHYTTTLGTGSTQSALGSSPYNNTRTVVYRTTLGALNGNYTEVGVGWASGANMFSRALILDGGGSPTTIAVNSAQQLDIVYQLSVYPPLTDTGPDVVTISGVDYDVTGRAYQVNSVGAGSTGWSCGTSGAVSYASWGNSTSVFSGAIGAITGGPSGSFASATSFTSDSYSNNSLTRTGYQTFGLTDGSVAGGTKSNIARWSAGEGFAGFQYEFDPVIPKDGTKTLVLNHSVTWARRP